MKPLLLNKLNTRIGILCVLSLTFWKLSYGQIYQPESGVTDIDGNTYASIIIGDQEWTAENLRTSHYSNGDPIPIVTDNIDWMGASWQFLGARCWYQNDSISYDSIYGNLYNGHAARDPRGLCPTGWHIPSDEEWTTLELYLGLDSTELDVIGFRGDSIGGMLKTQGTNLWQSPNLGATNISGFSAIPGRSRLDNGDWEQDTLAAFWTSSLFHPDTSGAIPELTYRRVLLSDSSSIGRDVMLWIEGLSCRCVKGAPNSIEERTGHLKSIRVHPNPGTDVINVECQKGIRHLTVYDLSGRIQIELNGNGRSKTQVSLEGLAAGLYSVTVVDKSGRQHVTKIVKK